MRELKKQKVRNALAAVLFCLGMLLVTGEGDTFGVTFAVKLSGVVCAGIAALILNLNEEDEV
jgi:hypothetical protein